MLVGSNSGNCFAGVMVQRQPLKRYPAKLIPGLCVMLLLTSLQNPRRVENQIMSEKRYWLNGTSIFKILRARNSFK